VTAGTDLSSWRHAHSIGTEITAEPLLIRRHHWTLRGIPRRLRQLTLLTADIAVTWVELHQMSLCRTSFCWWLWRNFTRHSSI